MIISSILVQSLKYIKDVEIVESQKRIKEIYRVINSHSFT